MEGSPQSTLNLKKVHGIGEPVSACLFKLCLEILFMLIKNNKNIKSIKMFENTFLYNAYADDSTFFLKDNISVKELPNTINYFSCFMGLKPNISKCEDTGIGALEGVKVGICGIKCLDLTEKAIKILGVFFSYDKNLQLEKNFRKTILNIERILKMWRRRDLTLECKIIALSKVTFLAQVLVIPKDFLWNSSSARVKHETICKIFNVEAEKR